MSRRDVLRFAVVNEQSGRHSGVWPVWTNQQDVYFGPADMGKLLKVSLHPTVWQVAYTTDHWESGEEPRNSPGPGRRIWKIEPLPEMIHGVQRAWRLAFVPDALLQVGRLHQRTVTVATSDPCELVSVILWICAPETTDAPPGSIHPLPLRLSDGRTLWAAVERDRLPPSGPPKTPYVGSIIAFEFLERPGDTPGFVLQPVNVE